MAEPFAPYAGIEGAALTGGEGGDLLQKLLLGVLQGTAQIPQHVIDAAAQTALPGLRREDFTDTPPPSAPFGPQAWQPGDEQRAAAVGAALATMGGTSFGAPAGAIGAGPAVRRAALPMDEASRMARAAKQGYTTDAYHGTTSEFPAFRRVEGGNARGDGYYFTTSPETASRYAVGDVNRITPQGNAHPNVMPMKLKTERPFDELSMLTRKEINEIEKVAIALGEPWKRGELARLFDRAYMPKGQNVLQSLSYDPNTQNNILRAAGYDSRVGGGIGAPEKDIVIFDPANARSRFAKFDASNLGKNDLLGAFAGAAPVGLLASMLSREDGT